VAPKISLDKDTKTNKDTVGKVSQEKDTKTNVGTFGVMKPPSLTEAVNKISSVKPIL
jgi:hypothetical protein